MSEDLEVVDAATLARLRADFASTDARSDTSAEPIEPERIWAAVHGELAPEECVTIIDRLHKDPALALEWRLALALREGESKAASRAANGGRYWVIGALALAAASVLLIVLPRDGSTPRSSGVEVDSGQTLREAELDAAIQSELVEPSLPAAAFELRWTAVPGALRYELQVTTQALDPVFTARDLSDNRALVPASELELLAPGTELIWRVTAVMPDGQRRSSPALSVSLR